MAATFLLDVKLGRIGGLSRRRKIGSPISLEMDPRQEALLHPTPMMIKSVVTNGEEHVLLQQAALAPLLLKSAPIPLASVGGLGCTLGMGENPR